MRWLKGRMGLSLVSVVATAFAACGGTALSLQQGTYTARTASGQTVTVHLRDGNATLGWEGPVGTLPVTVTMSGQTITLNFGLGLHVSGTIVNSTTFKVSYTQYPNGEPELGEPSASLTFRRG